MADLDTLRQIAQAATPGRWLRDGSTDVFAGGCGCTGDLVATSHPQRGSLPTEVQQDNAHFVATFDPATVLALLDVAEAARHVDQDLTPATRLALGDALTDLDQVTTHG